MADPNLAEMIARTRRAVERWKGTAPFADDVRALCDAAERCEHFQFEYRECLRTRSELLHERNELRTECDALRRALEAIKAMSLMASADEMRVVAEGALAPQAQGGEGES